MSEMRKFKIKGRTFETDVNQEAYRIFDDVLEAAQEVGGYEDYEAEEAAAEKITFRLLVQSERSAAAQS